MTNCYGKENTETSEGAVLTYIDPIYLGGGGGGVVTKNRLSTDSTALSTLYSLLLSTFNSLIIIANQCPMIYSSFLGG